MMGFSVWIIPMSTDVMYAMNLSIVMIVKGFSGQKNVRTVTIHIFSNPVSDAATASSAPTSHKNSIA